MIGSSSLLGFRSQQRLLPNPISAKQFNTLTLSLSQAVTSKKQRLKHAPTKWKTAHSFVQSNPLLSLLQSCKCLSQLKQIQARMTVTGLISDPFASSRIVAFCALSESRNLTYCVRILFSSERANSFSWNVAIKGYSESESPSEAIGLYKRMLEHGCGLKPDSFTYPFVLKACASLELNSVGFQFLGHVFKLGFESYLFVHNAAIYMLVSCGEFRIARKLFNESPVRDRVSWNSMINGYARAGLANDALGLYRDMEAMGIEPDDVTIVGLVSSCAKLENLSKGREFHRLIVENGLNLTVPLANALMDMYVKCGNLEAAKELFDNMTNKTTFSWTTMIAGFSRSGFLDAARELLYEIPEKNVVPWNAMISGYVQAKCGREALALFQEMQLKDIMPDEITLTVCLSACSQLGALDVGIWIHRYIEKYVFSLNVALGTALVDMYAKCGNIAKAIQVFWEMPGRNALTWTAIICGLAIHGHARDAISYFDKMIDAGQIPDNITFLGLLSACCHGGLVEEGRKYFSRMKSKFNLYPDPKHYSCMVDLLGRAGHLEEAEELIKSMPIEADAVVWGALLSACRVHRNVAMGERTATKLLKLEPSDSGNYVLLSGIYKEARMWDRADKARKMMRDRGVDKTPGCSLIEVNGVVCEFTVGDNLHHRSRQIYECLFQLTREIEIVGCSVPEVHTFRDNFLTEFFQ